MLFCADGKSNTTDAPHAIAAPASSGEESLSVRDWVAHPAA